MSPLAHILGVPITAKERDLVFERMKQRRSPEEALVLFRDGAQHNTSKSGALLSAQGIFVVVYIFALDHGWPNALVLSAMLATLLGSLLTMMNLRGTLGPYMHEASMDMDVGIRRTYELVLVRSIRFNLALYLTFLSILILAAAAIVR